MQLFVIATIREKLTGQVIKFRILDKDTEEVLEATPDELITEIDRNEHAFKNMFKARHENGSTYYKFNIGVHNLPVVDLEDNLLSKSKYVALSKINECGQFVVAQYNGEVHKLHEASLKGLAKAREVANIILKKCDKRNEEAIDMAIDVVNY